MQRHQRVQNVTYCTCKPIHVVVLVVLSQQFQSLLKIQMFPRLIRVWQAGNNTTNSAIRWRVFRFKIFKTDTKCLLSTKVTSVQTQINITVIIITEQTAQIVFLSELLFTLPPVSLFFKVLCFRLTLLLLPITGVIAPHPPHTHTHTHTHTRSHS